MVGFDPDMPTHDDFYREKRYCPPCGTYVQYLTGIHSSHCVNCDARVRLFSEQDESAFLKLCRTPDPEDDPRYRARVRPPA